MTTATLAAICWPILLAGPGQPARAAIEAPRRIEAHGGRVHQVLFSPDGGRVASAAESEVKLWKVESGRELMRLPVRRASLAFRPDGNRLATADSSGIITIWDAANGRKLRSFRGHESGITSLTYSPNGERLAAALPYDDDGAVRVWEASDGRELLVLSGHTDPVRRVEFSPDGARLLTQDSGRTVKVWNASTGRQRLSSDGLGHAGFNADGRQIISVTQHGLVTFRDATTGRPLRSVSLEGLAVEAIVRLLGTEDQQEPPELLAFSRDRTLIAGKTIAMDRSAAVWELDDGMARVGLSVDEAITSLAISPDGRLAAAGDHRRDRADRRVGGEGGLWLWNLEEARMDLVLNGAERAVAFAPDGDRVAVKVSDRRGRGQIALRDAATGRVEQVIQADPRSINALAFSPDGEQVATLGSEGVVLWDADEGRRLRTWPGDHDRSLAFRPDGRQLVAARLGLISAWDPATGEEHFQVFGLPLVRRFNQIAYSPDGARLGIGGLGGVEIWDPRSGDRLGEIPVPASGFLGVEHFAFHPDGTQLAAHRSERREVVVLDLDSGREELTFPNSDGGVLAYSPDGRWIASVASDAVRLHDARTGQPRLALVPHFNVWDLEFSPDGRRLAVADDYASIRVWRLLLED